MLRLRLVDRPDAGPTELPSHVIEGNRAVVEFNFLGRVPLS